MYTIIVLNAKLLTEHNGILFLSPDVCSSGFMYFSGAAIDVCFSSKISKNGR